MRSDAPTPRFADATPLGLLCLAVGCAALVPIAFGVSLSPSALETAAWFCLVFGAAGQLLAGVLLLANNNLLGGTLFSTFAWSWAVSFWSIRELAAGHAPDPAVVLSVDVCFLVVFVVVTYAFAFVSKLLVAFLADIDLLYALRIAKALTHNKELGLGIAVCTVALAGIALWLAFAEIVNPLAGRAVFRVPGPLLSPLAPSRARSESEPGLTRRAGLPSALGT